LLSRIQLPVRLSDIGVVALVYQVFLGGHVVIEAGFGEAQTTRNIGQCGRARALGIEQFCGTGEHRGALGLTLQAPAEGRSLFGVEVFHGQFRSNLTRWVILEVQEFEL